VSYTYRADGSLASKTDAKNQPTTYTYDNYGRLTQASTNTIRPTDSGLQLHLLLRQQPAGLGPTLPTLPTTAGAGSPR